MTKFILSKEVGAAGGTRTPKVSPADFKSAVYANSTTAAQISLYGLRRLPSTPVIDLAQKFFRLLGRGTPALGKNSRLGDPLAKIRQFA